MNIFNHLYKRRLEKARGRIEFYSGLWAWDDDPPELVESKSKGNFYFYTDTALLGFIHYKRSEDGRYYKLIKGPSVHCTHPKWTDTEHVPYSGGHWVPSKLCKRCEHYRKGGSVRRKIRYPTCAWEAADNPDRAARKAVLDAFTKASETAEDLLSM